MPRKMSIGISLYILILLPLSLPNKMNSYLSHYAGIQEPHNAQYANYVVSMTPKAVLKFAGEIDGPITPNECWSEVSQSDARGFTKM